MDSRETQQDTSNSPARADLSLPALLGIFGISLLIFGAKYAKGFGVVYLAAAAAVQWGRPFVYWLDSLRITQSTRRASSRATTYLCAVVSRAETGLWAAAGMALAVVTWPFWDRWPTPLPYFYLALSALLFAQAVRGRGPITRERHEHGGPRENRAWGALAAGAGLAAAAGLAGLTLAYGLNIPFYDEFMATLKFVTDFPEMTASQRATELLLPHFSHRIASTRLIALAQREAYGELDFFQLMSISFAFLLGAVAILYCSLRRELRSLALFAPFMLLLFQPQYHQLTLWGFSIPHFSVLFFAALAFYLVGRGTSAGFCLAMPAAIAAAFSFAPGIFVGLIGLVFLIDQRRYRHAAIWLVPMTFAVLRYFEGMTPMRDDAGLAAYGVSPPEFISKMFYFLEFLGSSSTLGVYTDFLGRKHADAAANPQALWLARAAGGALLTVFAYVTARRHWRRNITVYGLLVMTVLGAGFAAENRSALLNTSAFLSRYTINSVLFAGLLYLALLDFHPALLRRLLPFGVAASALFCGFSYSATIPCIRSHNADLQYYGLLASNGLYRGSLPQPIGVPLFDFEVLRRSTRSGVYSMPERRLVDAFASEPLTVSVWDTNVSAMPWRLLYIGENDTAYTFLLGDAAPASALSGHAAIALSDSAGRTLTFRAQPLGRLRVHDQIWKESGPADATYIACVPKAGLPAGRLSVAIAEVDGPSARVLTTPYVLPTLHSPAPALAGTGLPQLLHELGACGRAVEETSEFCTFPARDAEFPLTLPAAYSVEVLLQPDFAASQLLSGVWHVKADRKHGPRGIRLSLSGATFVLREGDGAQWRELARIPAVAGEWNWVCVSVDGARVTLQRCAQNQASGLGALQVATGRLSSFSGGMGGWLTVDGNAREVRVSAGALTTQHTTLHWPIFRVE